MKRNILFLILGLFAVLKSTAINQIAIYVIGDASDSYKKVVATSITQAVNNDGHFQAVERTSDFLVALGNEVSYQNLGAVNQSKIIELGRQFASQYVFVVDLNSLLGELYASSRIINVEKNVVEAASDESSNISNMEQLRNFGKRISSSTLDKLPYNVEKKRRVTLNSYRQFVNQYGLGSLLSSSDFYNYYKKYPNISKHIALRYIQACKELGIRKKYPLYYAKEFLHKGKPYKIGSKVGIEKSHLIKIKAYRINQYGEASYEIWDGEICPNGLDMGGSRIIGSYLHN